VRHGPVGISRGIGRGTRIARAARERRVRHRRQRKIGLDRGTSGYIALRKMLPAEWRFFAFHRQGAQLVNQKKEKRQFVALHAQPNGFIMPNAWDATSALLLKAAGFESLGTSSAALAASLGRMDGRHAVSAKEHIAHARLLTEISDLPVNGDFEDGYG